MSPRHADARPERPGATDDDSRGAGIDGRGAVVDPGFTVICCPDSFKGTATAREAADAMAAGVRDAGARAIAAAMADGGEGTAELLAAAWAATDSEDAEESAKEIDGAGRSAIAHAAVAHDVATVDAIGRPFTARWWEPAPGRAVLDLASASGLPAVADAPDALGASTFGTGEVILDALAHGATDITVCLGGSATTDGGAGLITALGARVLGDAQDPGGGALARATRIDFSALDPRARRARWTLVLDVTTPPRDAPSVFGPQKGATPEQVEQLTGALLNWCRICGVDPVEPGYGAAGATPVGIAALVAAADGTGRPTIERGAPLLARATGLDHALTDGTADLILTGEGSVDAQSHVGKVVGWIVDAAAEHAPGGRTTPVHVIGGRVDEGAAVVKRAHAATALPGPPERTREQLRRAAYDATLRAARTAGRARRP
ncbi:glycerate kinase [Corynebacterium hansenii]|uniref:Glycerate kinase n=1 Tax=Corynebacterium hansenii TaxID=394964 RepID=A0ABV7ZPC7_9CORY|nr:glycerate kinase [Corynebacterium hansenii]WJZ00195.1 Glycerate 2-kinase [Corynebacterium hansenii]